MAQSRGAYILGFLLAAGATGLSFYLEIVKHVQPCPLCIFQRCTMIVLALLFLLAILQKPKTIGNILYGLLITLAAGIGAFFSGRQLWLQTHQDQGSQICTSGVLNALNNTALPKFWNEAINGSGSCSVDNWSWLHVPLSGWALALFTIIALIGLVKIFGGGK